jgi:hypothetical protein
MKTLQPLIEQSKSKDMDLNSAELYCQLLEHKWYLSERAQRDVGHRASAEDYLKKFLEKSGDELNSRP